MAPTDTPLFDADNHYYEPRDAFTRFIEPRFRDKAIHLVKDETGRDRVMIGDRPFTFLENAYTEQVTKPGALREMLRNLSSGNFSESEVREPLQPEYTNREARLRLMDEQGLQSILLFPTLAVCVEHFMKDDVELAHVTKKWAGLGKELFTSADNYVLEISDSVPPDNPIRQLIMAAVMCIDMVLKE